MKVNYKNRAIEKICTNATTATKKYGQRMAEVIHLRIDQISAALNVEMMIKFRIGRCHPLTGNRKGQYAVDLEHPYRMIFVVEDGTIQIAEIQEIVDYH